jgi:chemotaxis protein MotB
MRVSRRNVLMVVRAAGLLGLLVAALVLNGCGSCKEYQEQIAQMDTQISDLQQQIGQKESRIAEADELAKRLRSELDEAKAQQEVLVERMNQDVTVTLPDRLTFASGSDIILDTMVPTLEAIANGIRDYPDWDVYVEGYTDDFKIFEDFQFKWPTNWELAAGRACAVVRYLTNQLDLPAERFACVSYGPFRPFATNDTPEGREQNRVVRVLLHKKDHGWGGQQ